MSTIIPTNTITTRWPANRLAKLEVLPGDHRLPAAGVGWPDQRSALTSPGSFAS